MKLLKLTMWAVWALLVVLLITGFDVWLFPGLLLVRLIELFTFGLNVGEKTGKKVNESVLGCVCYGPIWWIPAIKTKGNKKHNTNKSSR